jgi:penicillin-binding protein 2
VSLATLIIIILIVLAVIVGVFVFLSLKEGSGRFTFDIGGHAPTASGGQDSSSETTFKARLTGLEVAAGAVIAALFAKLWSMQLMSSGDYAQKAESNRTRTISVEAPRGRILDRNGIALVTNRASLTAVAESAVNDDAVEVQLVANVLGMPPIAVRRKIADSSAGAQSKRVVASDVPRRVYAYLAEHSDFYSGIDIEERAQRSYPFGQLAAHVLGYTGQITTDQLNAQGSTDDESAITYESGDTVGQAGIEYQYESVLQGIRGEQKVYVDANGRVTSYSTSVPATNGSDIMLTIDKAIQQAAEDGLAHAIQAAIEKGNPACKSGACIVLDATNGDVLAMASAPKFDPGAFIGGISNSDWDALSSSTSGNPLMNKPVSGQYMSASTIKPVNALAALDYGIATPETGYDCTGYWTGFGASFGQYCWLHTGHGYMTLQSGITNSCDTVFYEIGKGFYYSDHNEGMQDTMKKWGLGQATGIDLPSEGIGRVPTPEWKHDYYSSYSDEDRKWQGGDSTNLSIGQGDLLVSPLQMACIYMGIANRGTIWRPHVLKSVLSQAGGTVSEYNVSVLNQVNESDDEFTLVIEGCKGVVYEESASMASHFTNMKETFAGKTGSGEKTGEAATGWFCCFGPVDSPKYVCVAVVENGGFGATSAMYAVRDTLGAIYNEPDTSTTSVDDSTR